MKPNPKTSDRPSERTLQRIASLSNADIVFEHENRSGCIVMLKHHGSESFAVCALNTARTTVVAPNFQAPEGDARFLGELSKKGVQSVLDWVDRATALERYLSLVGRPPESETVVPIFRGATTRSK